MSKNKDNNKLKIRNIVKLAFIFSLPVIILILFRCLPWAIDLIKEYFNSLDNTLNQSINNIITF